MTSTMAAATAAAAHRWPRDHDDVAGRRAAGERAAGGGEAGAAVAGGGVAGQGVAGEGTAGEGVACHGVAGAGRANGSCAPIALHGQRRCRRWEWVALLSQVTSS